MIVHRPESVTGRVGDLLEARGFELDICRLAAGDKLPPDMSAHDCAVIYGGPMSATDGDEHPFLNDELDWLPGAVQSGKPVLGLCLGAQLMALAHGAKVAPRGDGKVEVGYYEVEPTNDGADWFDGPLIVYQFHGDGMELPKGTTHLATSAIFPTQAFKFDGVPAFGLQFHPEVTYEMMERWVVRAAERLQEPGAQSAEAHLQGHARHDPAFAVWLGQFMDKWLSSSC